MRLVVAILLSPEMQKEFVGCLHDLKNHRLSES